MNKLFKGLAIASIAMSASFVQAADSSATLGQLLEKIQKERISETRIDKKREAEFRSARSEQASILRKAKAAREAEKARGKQLLEDHAANERRMAQLDEDLAAAQGDLKEAFGVVRGVAGDTTGIVAASVISAQYPGRADELAAIGALKGLPGLAELENLWFALQTEMTESANISKFKVAVSDTQGDTTEREVTRVGAFNLLDSDGYLVFRENGVSELAKQPQSHIAGSVSPYLETTSGYTALYLDPSRGSLLNLLTGQATLEEKYHQGETVGYIITAVLIIGLLIALERVITLTLLNSKVNKQLKNPNTPGNNPLGRILKVYHNAKGTDVETLELRLDEAILKEIPRLERGISIIKVLAAIAPMLGLLGTVTGMIGTFQAITLFGTGDPKMMAGGISTALVTTVLGLVAALPLMLVHAVVSGRSKSLLHVLEEQSVGIIAEHAEKESN